MSEQESESIAWDPDVEVKRTWAGELTIDSERRVAILTVTHYTEETHRLAIPRAKLESLIRDLDWARHRLEPWPERYAATPARPDVAPVR